MRTPSGLGRKVRARGWLFELQAAGSRWPLARRCGPCGDGAGLWPGHVQAIIVCAGNNDRYKDGVHYMGDALMLDNDSWSSAMYGWLPPPPDPAA